MCPWSMENYVNLPGDNKELHAFDWGLPTQNLMLHVQPAMRFRHLGHTYTLLTHANDTCCAFPSRSSLHMSSRDMSAEMLYRSCLAVCSDSFGSQGLFSCNLTGCNRMQIGSLHLQMATVQVNGVQGDSLQDFEKGMSGAGLWLSQGTEHS